MTRRSGHTETRRLRRAFTLVELLCVALLIAVAATTVTLRLAGTTEAARLRSARIEIEQCLRRARQFARLRHRPAWLELDPGGRVRAALAEPEGLSGVWIILDRVRIPALEIEAGPMPSGDAPRRIRVTPSGVTLPWRATIQAGERTQRLVSDGISPWLNYREPGQETHR